MNYYNKLATLVYIQHIYFCSSASLWFCYPHSTFYPFPQSRKCCPLFFLVYFFHFASIFLRSTIVLPDIQIAYFLMDMWNERMKKGRNDDTTSKEYFNYLLHFFSSLWLSELRVCNATMPFIDSCTSSVKRCRERDRESEYLLNGVYIFETPRCQFLHSSVFLPICPSITAGVYCHTLPCALSLSLIHSHYDYNRNNCFCCHNYYHHHRHRRNRPRLLL